VPSIFLKKNLEGYSHLGTPWLRLRLQEQNVKKEQYLLDVQSSTDKKLATTQNRQTLQNSDEKQYCQHWMLRLVVTN